MMRCYKRLLTLLLLMPAFAVAGVLNEALQSSIGPSDGDGAGDSAQVQQVEAEAQFRGGQVVGQKPQQIHSMPTSQTLTVNASIRSNGETYCPKKPGYVTPSVSSYKVNGYAQCVYQYSSK